MAAASVRLVARSLLKMLDTCTLAVFGAMNSAAAISLLLRPAAISRSTSRSRGDKTLSAAPLPSCCVAVPILARRARSSSAARNGRAPSRSAACAACRHCCAASSLRPASASASASRHRVRAIS